MFRSNSNNNNTHYSDSDIFEYYIKINIKLSSTKPLNESRPLYAKRETHRFGEKFASLTL